MKNLYLKAPAKRHYLAVINSRREQARLFLLLLIVGLILISLPIYLQAAEPFRKPFKSYNLECGQYGGEFFLAATSDPKSFNPMVAQETSTTQITSFIFEGLTATNPLTLEVKPALASSWETQDGKVWIFHLRHDVKFSDGVPFTADDVLFTFNQIIYNPDIPANSRDLFIIDDKKIELEKIDDHTVKFILPFVFAPFLRSLSQEILPKHKYEKLVEEGKFSFSLGLDTKPIDIVGTGPFKLAKYLPSEKVILIRNPDYWKKDACQNKLPFLDKIVFAITPSQDTALLKFIDKELDYYSLRPQDLSILGPDQDKDNFTIYNAGPSFGSNFIALNQNLSLNPKTSKTFIESHKLALFRNKKFRKAISFAVNREKIVDIVMQGLGQPQYSCESPANALFYNKDVIKYPYNPKKAKQLLSEIGFSDRDQDGFLEDSQGKALEFNFFTNADNTQRIQIGSLIKKDLEDLGMKINFMPLDFNNLVTKLTATFDWEVILIGLTGSIEPYFGKNVWSYKGSLHFWNTSKKVQDAYEQEIEDIFNLAAKTIDEDKRKQLFFRWQEIVSDELPMIYTAVSYSLYAVRRRFGNLYPTVYSAFGEIEHVYIRD